MKKIILLLFIVSFWGINAQNRPGLPKEQERALLQKTHPIAQRNDAFRSPNATIFLDENFDAGTIPATWLVVDNTGNAAWTVVSDYNTNTLDGTPFAFIDSDSAGSVDVDTELISPEFDASSAVALFISFDHYFNSYSGNDKGEVDVFDGTNWVNVYSTSADIGAWGNPDHQLIDVTAYKNANFKIRFHYYDANYDWFWAVDNVMVFQPDADDLMVTGTLPETFLPNDEFPISTKVFNNGTNTQNDFDVIINVKDASNTVVYTETINVTGANLTPGATQEFTTTTMAVLPAGVYTIESTVSLANDQEPGNDMFASPLHIIDYASTYSMDTLYSFIAFDGDNSGDNNDVVSFNLPNADTVTSLGNANTADFLVAGTFIDGLLVGVEFGTNMIYFIDGSTGQAYKFRPLIGDVDGITLTGIAYDAATDETYFSSVDLLFKLNNTPDLSTTIVGAMNNAGGVMIGIDFDNNGNLYGIDLGDDQLYAIDITTGAATAIGPLGIDISYAQDMGTDPTTGNLYGTLYAGAGTSGVYTIDKITGAATAVGTLGDDEYTLCAILGTTNSISENTIEGLKVYPNPTNGMILVNAKENIQNISVINLAGQEVMKIQNNGLNAQLDMSNLTSGSYILKITTDKTVATYQVTKK